MLPYVCVFQADMDMRASTNLKRVLSASPKFEHEQIEDSASEDEPEWDGDEGEEEGEAEDDDDVEQDAGKDSADGTKENLSPDKLNDLNKALHSAAAKASSVGPSMAQVVQPTSSAGSASSNFATPILNLAQTATKKQVAPPKAAPKKKAAADEDEDFKPGTSSKTKARPKPKPRAAQPKAAADSEPSRARLPPPKRSKTIESDAVDVAMIDLLDADGCTLRPCLKHFCRSLAIIEPTSESIVACPGSAYLRPIVQAGSAFDCIPTGLQLPATLEVLGATLRRRVHFQLASVIKSSEFKIF